MRGGRGHFGMGGYRRSGPPMVRPHRPIGWRPLFWWPRPFLWVTWGFFGLGGLLFLFLMLLFLR